MKASRRCLAGLAIVLVVGLPFIPLVLWALAERWFFPALWPQSFGLRAWTYITSTAGVQVLSAVGQSMTVAAITAVIAVAIAVPAGRALGLYEFKGKDLVSVLLTLPVIVPPLCVAMGLHL